MSKKHKTKKSPPKESKPNFLEVHWEKIILVFLFILPLIYFSSFLSPNRMIAGSDYLIGGYPFEKWIREQEELPLWYSHVFGGIPVLGAPQGGPLAPLAQLKEIMPPQIVLTLTFIIFFFIAGLGMYLYLKEIGLSKYSAAVGAVVYQFIGNLATTPAAGHAGRAASIASFPLMIFFIHRALKSKRLMYFILFSLVTALAFYEGHFQITYYGLLFIIGYVIYYLITHRKEIPMKDLLNIIIYGLCAIVFISLLMAVVWLPVLGGLGTAARAVERGYSYATSWSLSPHELIDLVIPTYSGILGNYWGLNPFKLHLEYFGIFTVILAIFALIFCWKRPYVKYYVLKICIVLFVVLGSYTPLFRIFYTIIPGFRLFRAPALAFYLISFSFIVLAAIGFDNIFVKKREDNKKNILRKRFLTFAGILLAVFFITGLVCTAGRDSIVQSMQSSMRSTLAPQKLANIENNFPQFIEGIWRALIFVAAILFMIYISIKKKINAWLFAIAAIIIILIDQLPFTTKFLPSAPRPDVYYASDDVVRFIKKDKTVFRVFPLQYEHSTDSYLLYHNLQSAGGYIPNPIQRYQDYIGAGTSVMFNPLNLFEYPRYVDMLNIKYIIAPNLPDDISRYSAQAQLYINEMKKYLTRFRRVFSGRQYSVYRNDNLLPRAYIVSDYRVYDTDEVLDSLASENFEPKQTVLLENEPDISRIIKDENLPQPEVKIITYSPNRVECIANCSYPGFLVLADNWHPDWQVFVDGKESNLYVANYTFRAVYVPAGEHDIVFAFISPYFSTGRLISIIALVLAISFCVMATKFKV